MVEDRFVLTGWKVSKHLGRLIETFTAPQNHRIDALLQPSLMLGDRALTVYAACAASQCLDGVIVECGVAEGETAAGLVQLADWRPVYLFDTFGTVALAARNDLAAKAVGDLACDRAEVEQRIALAMKGHTYEVYLMPGLFKDTLPKFDRHVAFLHADGDLYESTCDIIAFADRLVVRGGIVVFDDYGTEWTGVTKAVDEKLDEERWRTYAVVGYGQLVAVRR